MEKKELALAGERLLYKNYLKYFVRKVFATVSPGDRYIHNWHIDCICDYLTAVHHGDIKQLVINIQPRSLKSIICSVAFPAWVMGINPTARFLCASYAYDIAEKMSVDTRLVIETDWYKELFPHTRIAYDQNKKQKFLTTERGQRMATSVGGTVIGEGGDYLILDDPNKPDEALSETVRLRTNSWVDQTFMTRRNNMDSKVVVIMQRLHEDDVAGHLLRKGSWEHLVIPTIAPVKTIIDIGENTYKREQGEVLNSRLQTPEYLDEVKREIGEYGWAGQYQQSPSPLGGGELKEEWLIHDDVQLQNMNYYITVDPGFTKKKTSDYTAMVVWGLAHDKNFYLVDGIRDRLDSPERRERLIQLIQKWQPKRVGYEIYGNKADVDYLRERMKELNLRGYDIVELRGRMAKEDRIRRLIPYFHDSRIILPNYGFYVKDYLGHPRDIIREFVHEEYLPFPMGKHDDFLDAMSRILDDDMKIIFPKHRVEKSTRQYSNTTGGMYL